MQRWCSDCEFFCPEGGLGRANDLAGSGCGEGECRKHPPVVGDVVKFRSGDEERWFGNFPRVTVDDWCGEFTPCAWVSGDGQDGSRRPETAEDVRSVIARLPEDLGELCRDLMSLSPPQIARKRGVHHSTVYRAIAKLREHFTNAGIDGIF